MISVVIPAHNAAHTLPECLQALKDQTLLNRSYEIIVVDDGSTDDTAAVAQRFGAMLIRHDTKRGAAAARNSGIKQAKGDLICFTDADCVPTTNWLKEMIAPFAQADIVGCKGIYATRQQSITAQFVQIEYEDKYDYLRRQPTIDFIDTYSAAYRRHILLGIKGFDERIFFVEDQELSFRLAAQQHKMVFQPTAVVFHHHSDTWSKYARKKFMIGYWKTQIIRRFPNRAIKDSHTPQMLKLQIILVALGLLGLLFAIFMPLLNFLSALIFLLFVSTTIPFGRKAWSKNKKIALWSPVFLLIRALSLGFGTAWGMLWQVPHIDQITTSL